MNPEQWLSLKWNGGSTMSDRWLNQSKIIHFYKKEQIFRNTTIDRLYIQVKFHMKQNKEFTIENLLDSSFIDAKSESFLQKAVNTY